MQPARWRTAAILLAFHVALAGGSASALDLFVDQRNGDDLNDGLSWTTAKATVGAALLLAQGSPGPDTVSVAAGRYPEAMTVPAEVTLLGGFPPGGGARDPDSNPTILDASGLASTVARFPPGSDRTLLDGFVLRGGDNGMGGGGLMIEDSAPLIRGNLIEENSGCRGAGVHLLYTTVRAAARIEGNRIRRNTGACTLRIPPQGGGVWILAPVSLDLGAVLAGNVIEGNDPGGVFFSGRGRVEHTLVRGNAGGLGLDGFVQVFNAEVTRNIGAGLTIPCAGGTYRLENVTISDNGGPGLSVVSPLTPQPTDVGVLDSILWADRGGEILWDCPGGTLSVASALVQGGWPGGTNILDADPLFVPGPSGDFYLSHGAAGQTATSPAVDAGSLTSAAVGLDSWTTRTDSVPDAGSVDLGHHYPAIPALTILRGTAADILAPYRVVSSLPFDDMGALTDPGLPRLYYRLREADNQIIVHKDVTGGALRLEFLAAP